MMRKLIFGTFVIIFSCSVSYAATSRALLFKVAYQIQQLSDPTGKLKGITYHVTTDNLFSSGWLIQTPNVWGKDINQIAYFLPNCANCNADFGLPTCEIDSQCAMYSPTGASSQCMHLNAFNNGISGQSSKMC